MKRFLSFLVACLFLPALALAFNTHAAGFLPPVVSEQGRQIDALYGHILAIVVVIFVITEGILIYCVVAFRARPGHKARFFHGSTGVELILAGVPAVILLYITVVSARLWERLRMDEPKNAVHIEVLAEQFDWNFRYPGPDAVFGTPDDVMTNGECAVPVDRQVVFFTSSKDVIHSFFLPDSRVKEDVVPGLLNRIWTKWEVIPVWDLATQKRVLLSEKDFENAPVAFSGYAFKSKPHPGKKWYQFSDSARIGYNAYYYERDPSAKLMVMEHDHPVDVAPRYVLHYFEIACAQLCGPLHFAMRGTVRVLPEPEYEAWLKAQPKDDYLASKWAQVWDGVHPDFDRAL